MPSLVIGSKCTVRLLGKSYMETPKIEAYLNDGGGGILAFPIVQSSAFKIKGLS